MNPIWHQDSNKPKVTPRPKMDPEWSQKSNGPTVIPTPKIDPKLQSDPRWTLSDTKNQNRTWNDPQTQNGPKEPWDQKWAKSDSHTQIRSWVHFRSILGFGVTLGPFWIQEVTLDPFWIWGVTSGPFWARGSLWVHFEFESYFGFILGLGSLLVNFVWIIVLHLTN